MISIIISTYKPENFESISQNIEKTIGIKHEIIGIENHGKYSICEAYNIGTKQANYSYVCFLHDDITFYTENWGQYLVSLMKSDASIGLIGIAGTKFKSTYPNTGWGNGPFLKKFNRGHLYTDVKQTEPIEIDIRKIKDEVEDVLIVDGLFLFTKSDVLEKCQFDEKILKHYHAYDADFSLQVFFSGYRVLIDRSISLIHYSKGVFASDFANENKKIINKWKSKLPVATPDLQLTKVQLYYYDFLCWSGYIKNWLVRKINAFFKN